MKLLLILKLGSTLPAIAETHGDFEDWFIAGMGIPRDRVHIVHALEGSLPAPEAYCGILVTGSHSMVTDEEPWALKVQNWLPGVVEARVPLLAVCFGHQLLAKAMGGEVGFSPQGPEFGTVTITTSPEAAEDELFGHLPPKFDAHVAHSQTVLRLPGGAKVLASSELEPHQAFVLHDLAWGIQFHPEFSEEVTRAYILDEKASLRSKECDVDSLLASVRPTPEASQLLAGFAATTMG
jgi:GMP synthase (glutamine-hydrolysing)